MGTGGSNQDYHVQRWIKYDFLARRSLESPDARPLYAYRCSEAELDRALQLLCCALRATSEVDGRHTAALFCLVCAELWKREHDGGAWRWQVVLRRVGMIDDYGRVQTITKRGLEFWGRPLRQSGHIRRYLFSLVLEGGFPLRLAHRGGNRLSEYLKRVLSDIIRFEAVGMSAERIAARHAGMLPSSFHGDEMFVLVAELLCHFQRFRQLLPSSVSPQDATRWLDEAWPEWRDTLPLAVDDNATQRLLSGLVEEVARLGRMEADCLPALCHRSLMRHGDVWQPKVVLDLAGRIAPERFPESIRAGLKSSAAVRAKLMPGGTLASRLTVPLAILRMPQGTEAGQSWTVDPLSGADCEIPLPMDEPVTVAMVVSGAEIGYCSLPGGEAVGDGPWVFRANEDEDGRSDEGKTRPPTSLTFIGCGSVRTQRTTLYVAMGRDDDTLTAEANGAATPIGRLDDDSTLYRVTGTVRISRPDQRFPVVLRTGVPDEAVSRIVVRGSVPRWRTGTVDTICGDGSVLELTTDGRSTRPASSELFWRPVVTGGQWAPLPKTGWPLGLIDIALVRDNGIVDRARVAVLPKTADLDIRGRSVASGALIFRGFGGARLSIDRTHLPGDAVIEIVSLGDGAVTVEIRCVAEPPADVRILIDGQGEPGYGGGAIPMTLPFPGRGCGFIGSDGHWLGENARLALDMLYGVRARVSGSLHGHGDLLGYLETRDANQRQVKVCKAFSREYPLASLRDAFTRLLSAGHGIDDSVMLTMTGDGGERRLRILRFDISLSVIERNDDGSRLFGFKASIAADGCDNIEILAKRLTDLSEPETPLPIIKDSDGQPRWLFQPADLAPGCWLIYGRLDGRHRVRPIMKTVAGAPDAYDPSSLKDCIGIADLWIRQDALAMRLQGMTQNPLDPDWEELASVRKSLQDSLPLITMDMFKILSSDPAALAMCLARSGGTEVEAVLRMAHELPFSWQLLPIKVLGDAFLAVRDARAQDFSARGLEKGAKPLADRSVLDTLRRIQDADPSLTMTCALILDRLGLSDPGCPGAAQFADPRLRAVTWKQLTDARRRLLDARQDERGWPLVLDFRNERLTIPLPSEFAQDPPPLRSYLDAPFVAAIVAWTGTETAPDIRHALEFCRDADPAWFEDAYLRAVALLSQKPHRFEV